jgi:hypothetical protein
MFSHRNNVNIICHASGEKTRNRKENSENFFGRKEFEVTESIIIFQANPILYFLKGKLQFLSMAASGIDVWPVFRSPKPERNFG